MSFAGITPDERKLQPVYEDIQCGRYKAAESTVTRHLKKNPKSQTGLTLRFVLHERLHAPEATWKKSLKDARSVGDLNPRSLWWITTSLKALKRLDLCVGLYQEMWDAYPSSDEVGEQVFLYAAAAWDTKVMAESSRKMFNAAKDETWARLAAWAEWANPTPSRPYPPPAPAGSLKIASILLGTAGPSVPTSDILWLRFQILLSSGEHKKCYDLLMEHGRGGSLARDWYRMKGIEELDKRESGSKDKGWLWERELGEYLNLWSSDDLANRNYAYYQHSIAAAKVLLGSQPDSVKTLISTLETLHTSIGTKERAPLLARLELDVMLKERTSDLALSEGEWKKLVSEYWTKWGSKGSIVPELEAVAGDRLPWMQALMESRIAESQHDEKSYKILINAHIFLLRQKPKAWIPDEEDIKRYWCLYIVGLAYGKNLPRTDIQPADEIGLATVQLVLSTQTPNAPLRAILSLEYILSQSPSCAHARFLLIRLYRLVGALPLATPLMDDLKPSEVQLDTLMHIWLEGGATDALLAPLPKGQEIPAWDKWTSAMEKMYNKSSSDLPEYVKQAIENGSFSKIHSIRSLARTFSNSLTHFTLQNEKARHSLLQGTVPDLAAVARSEDVEDTRNWELMPSIGGLRTSVGDLTKMIPVEAGVLQKQAEILSALCSKDGVSADTGMSVEMSTIDERFYSALTKIIKRVKLENDESLDNLFDDILAISEYPIRWSVLHHGAHIIELAKVLDVKSQELAQGKTKPQKALGKELKDVRSCLKNALKPLVGKLNGMIMDDREFDWRGVNGDLLDADFVEAAGRKIGIARAETLEKLKGLLERL